MLRLSGKGRGFRHGGFELSATWQKFETLTPEQRDTLRDRHGRFIRVHPEDRDNLRTLGLEYQGPEQPLSELEALKPADPTPTKKTSKPADAAKADAKKD